MESTSINPVVGKTINNKTEKTLEADLSAFAHRFPVSGRIVHAISREVGGVLGLAALLEKQGLWKEVETWMSTGKPTTLSTESIYSLFSPALIDKTAGYLDIPVESVEIQLALGIPKFFTTLGHSEEDDLGMGYGTAKKKNKSKNRQRHDSANPP